MCYENLNHCRQDVTSLQRTETSQRYETVSKDHKPGKGNGVLENSVLLATEFSSGLPSFDVPMWEADLGRSTRHFESTRKTARKTGPGHFAGEGDKMEMPASYGSLGGDKTCHIILQPAVYFLYTYMIINLRHEFTCTSSYAHIITYQYTITRFIILIIMTQLQVNNIQKSRAK